MWIMLLSSALVVLSHVGCPRIAGVDNVAFICVMLVVPG